MEKFDGTYGSSAHVGTLYLSTCGTSLLTNFARDHVKLVYAHANAPSADDVPREARATLQALLDTTRDRFLAYDDAESRRASAEYNPLSLLGALEGSHRTNEHVLLHTDTWLGRAVAEILAEKIRAHCPTVWCHTVPELRSTTTAELRPALAALARWCADELPSRSARKLRVVFNLTGGFKSVQGFLQTVGMLYADECVYVFESGHEVLRLPRLPVCLDIEGAVRRGCDVFRRLDVGYPVTQASAAGIPETLLDPIDGQVILSPWGELSWASVRSRLLAEGPLSSLTDSVRIGERCNKFFSGLDASRRARVQQQIDRLCALRDGIGKNLASLNLKALQGDPVPGSTHEFYLWSDGNAARAFVHLEKHGGREFVVIDTMLDHL
jgi:putative CRISPR-associated protein (TIGR02619 family)